MRNLLCIAIAFFAINLNAQDAEKVKQLDSISVENVVAVDSIKSHFPEVNSWQLSKHLIYESYPDSIKSSLSFIKGKEFLSLDSNGQYSTILKNSFFSGYWLKNNDLIVFKQKVGD